jgi:predicted branched-subunit amino acid permease
MTEPPEDRRRSVATLPLAVAGVCLFIPLVALLWVGSYSRVTPTVIGIPFFYWYQMLWVLISTVLTVVAYVLVRRHEKARKGGAAQ